MICITQTSKLFYCALWCHHSYLWCWTVCDMPSDPPHLLELNTNLVKGLCDDSNKDILHKPCKEKYHGAKIEGCPPAREAVNGSVHDEHPAFLWGCLIYCENASGCKTEQISTKLCHKTSNGVSSICNESLCPSPQLSRYCMYITENKYDHRILLKNLHYSVQKGLLIMPININNTSIL